MTTQTAQITETDLRIVNAQLISLIKNETGKELHEIRDILTNKNSHYPSMALSNPKMIGYWKKDQTNCFEFDPAQRKLDCIMQKPGKFFKKIIPGLKDTVIQKMVSKWLVIVNNYITMGFTFKITSKITKYYDDRNYAGTGGSLGNSCMRYSSCAEYVDFYKNYDVKLLVLTDSNNKIKGRALIWNGITFSKPGITSNQFMDRIYVHNDNDIQLFIDYANRKGIVRKTHQTYLNHREFTYQDIEFTDSIVKDTKTDFNRENCLFPFVDTLNHLDSDNMLSNISRNDSYTLDNIGGGYSKEGETCTECGESFDPDCEGVYIEDVGHICENCSDNYSYCDECSTYHHNDYSTWIDDDQVSICNDCFDDLYTYCADCNDVIKLDNVTEIDNDYYCKHCRDKSYTLCDQCNQWEQDKYIIIFDDESYCYDCQCEHLTDDELVKIIDLKDVA